MKKMDSRRRDLVLDKIEIFYLDEFPKIDKGMGFSFYKGTFVFWDIDYDKRVFEVVDRFENNSNLLAVGESEGCVSFIWISEPANSKKLKEGIEVDGDYWTTVSWTVIKGGE